MWSLFNSLINFTGGSSYSSTDTYILYGCLACTILILVVILDFLYRLLRSFIKR